MNASAEAHVNAFEPTASASLPRPSATAAPPDAQAPAALDLPLNDASVARAATPDVVRRALQNEPAATDFNRVTRMMDWVVVLTLVGLFVIGGLL